jgi:hypothetical protein
MGSVNEEAVAKEWLARPAQRAAEGGVTVAFINLMVFGAETMLINPDLSGGC